MQYNELADFTGYDSGEFTTTTSYTLDLQRENLLYVCGNAQDPVHIVPIPMPIA